VLQTHCGASGVVPDTRTLPPAPRRTDDQEYNAAVQSIKVLDTRPRAGDTKATARTIRALPFYDSDDTTLYADDYDCDPANRVSLSAPKSHVLHCMRSVCPAGLLSGT
jgi:hypothetical protein